MNGRTDKHWKVEQNSEAEAEFAIKCICMNLYVNIGVGTGVAIWVKYFQISEAGQSQQREGDTVQPRGHTTEMHSEKMAT